jgi:hypothetical protein
VVKVSISRSPHGKHVGASAFICTQSEYHPLEDVEKVVIISRVIAHNQWPVGDWWPMVI